MQIQVISLTSASDRRAAAAQELESHDLEFEFFDAVKGEAGYSFFNHMDLDQYRLNTYRAPLPTEIGCYASHLSLWCLCAQSQQPMVILEDDFRLEPTFSELLGERKSLTNAFGYVRLESARRRRAPLNRLRANSFDIAYSRQHRLKYRCDPRLCMLAYAVSLSAAVSLVSASETLIALVDKFIQKTWIHGVPIFGISPALVSLSQHSRVTTIGDRSRKPRPLGLVARGSIYKALGELERVRFDRYQRHALRVGRVPIETYYPNTVTVAS